MIAFRALAEGDDLKCNDLSDEDHEDRKKQTWTFGDLKYEGCPGCLLEDRELINLINMYYNTKNMGLPFTGGWAEQPFWVVHVMNILTNEDNRLQLKKAEAARAGR